MGGSREGKRPSDAFPAAELGGLLVGFGRPGGMIAFGTLEGGLEAEYKRDSIGLV